jgi:hypothetical protein
MGGIELVIILLMIAINSVFAAYEIALASVTLARLKLLVDEHRPGAAPRPPAWPARCAPGSQARTRWLMCQLALSQASSKAFYPRRRLLARCSSAPRAASQF